VLGYEFFKVDPETGKIHELDEIFGPDAQRDFWIKLDDLAHDICCLLEKIDPPAMPEQSALPAQRAEQEAVFLAETTSDLREQREVIRRDLLQHGYLVLPDRALSSVASEVKAAVREDLARCRMSIHFIGKNYSLVPEGGMESLLEIQNELAIERHERGGFARLLWIPPGLKAADERQQAIIDRLRLDPRFHKGSDLLETFLEDLRTAIQETLARGPGDAPKNPESASSTDDPPSVYLITDERDAELISPWADRLFDERLEVIRPVFKGDEAEIRAYHEESLSTCDGVLIFYGSGNECWVRRKLREIQKSAGYGRTKPRPVLGLCLVPPKTPEKESFRTHEAMVLPQWDGYAPDLMKTFVTQLRKASG
jgi:hypothetical protein